MVYPLQHRLQAGQQFLRVEGLTNVVVGAGFKAVDFFVPGIAGGQDDDRHVVAGVAPTFQHLQAGQFGQAQVENRGIVGFGRSQKLALRAVGCGVDDIAGTTQVGGQRFEEGRVVFDQ